MELFLNRKNKLIHGIINDNPKQIKGAKMKVTSKNIFKTTMIIGLIIVILNLIYYFVYNDPFFNKNTSSGILIMLVSYYFYEKSEEKNADCNKK